MSSLLETAGQRYYLIIYINFIINFIIINKLKLFILFNINIIY